MRCVDGSATRITSDEATPIPMRLRPGSPGYIGIRRDQGWDANVGTQGRRDFRDEGLIRIHPTPVSRCIFVPAGAVVPEYTIQAKRGASSGELAGTCAADKRECTTNMGRLGAKVAQFEWSRVRQPRIADTSEPVQGFTLCGDSDDANRRRVESRSPCQAPEARSRALRASFARATGALVRDDSS